MVFQLTDEQLKTALLQGNDAVALSYFFQHIRPYIQRTVLAKGGTEADANAFFTAALVQMAGQLREGQPLGDGSVYAYLEQLTVAHYQSWMLERQQAETPERPVSNSDTPTVSDYESLQQPFESVVLPQDEQPPVSDQEEIIAPPDEPTAGTLTLPTDEELKLVRRKIYTWKNIQRLSTTDQQHIWPVAGVEPSLMEYEANERLSAQIKSAPLPDWATQALQGRVGFDTWLRLQPFDERSSSRATAAPSPANRKSGVMAFYIFTALLLGLIGFSVWSFLNRPKPAPAVFEEHFNKPKSILADLEQRYAADSSGIERPAGCHELLAMADQAYTEGQLETAFNILVDLLNEEALLACHSDAYYFLGIILIDRGEPNEAIEMFSRIDNIELYGEDLYWYQSMAFVKMAQTDGESREIARRSLERFIENTNNPDRKMEAEKMLEDLE
jgi:hypothetical protein